MYLPDVQTTEVADYLLGRSPGRYVCDLVPKDNSPIELLFVFESPHIDEIRAGIPVVGSTGRNALNYLGWDEDKRNFGSLGSYVNQRHHRGDYRIGIVNVSTVPLQIDAIPNSSSVYPDKDCMAIKLQSIRRYPLTGFSYSATPKTSKQFLTQLIACDLQERLRYLNLPLSCNVALAGKFAQTFWNYLPTAAIGLPTLRVSHPAATRSAPWAAESEAKYPDLPRLQKLFRTIANQRTT